MDETELVGNVTVLEVGQLWPWAPELVAGTGFGWHVEPRNLLLIVDRADDESIGAVAGPIEVAVLAHGPLVGVSVKFSGSRTWDWLESLVWRDKTPTVPSWARRDPGLEDRAVFHVVLVDVTSKRVAAMRQFSISPHATRVLVREIRDRWATPTTNPDGLNARAAFNTRYPDVKAALRDAVARSKGGA